MTTGKRTTKQKFTIAQAPDCSIKVVAPDLIRATVALLWMSASRSRSAKTKVILASTNGGLPVTAID